MKRAMLSTAAAAAGVTGVLLTSHLNPSAVHASITGARTSTPQTDAAPPGKTTGGNTSNGNSSNGNSANGNSANGNSSNGSSSNGNSSNGNSSSTSQTVTGDVARHQYGPVQVQITVSQGSITAISLVQQPSDGRSRWINSQAVPILVSEALKAQSASIDGLSGATLTSQAFMSSLASAIQKAGL